MEYGIIWNMGYGRGGRRQETTTAATTTRRRRQPTRTDFRFHPPMLLRIFRSESVLEGSWGHRRSWGLLGASLDASGLLGPSRSSLGAILGSWALGSWGALGALLEAWGALLGPSWRHLGTFWGSLGALLGLSWGSPGSFEKLPGPILEAIDQKGGSLIYPPL